MDEKHVFQVGDKVTATQELRDGGILVAKPGDPGVIEHIDETLGDLPTCYWAKTNRFFGSHHIKLGWY